MIANGAAAALEACEELRVVSLDIRGAHMCGPYIGGEGYGHTYIP